MKKLLKIGLIILGGLAIVYSGLWVHELIHKLQYLGIERVGEEICVSIFANCKGNFGYYTVYPATQEAYKKGLEIAKTQEIGAYLTQIIYTIGCYLSGFFILKRNRVRRRYKKKYGRK